MAQRKVLITGTAGFIGFHLARLLLAEGFRVHGFDGMTNYYDVTLKQRRHAMLLQNSAFSATEGMLEDQDKFDALADDFQPDVIVHLAAQAGVRYSLENPRAYLDSNVIGTFHVMEAARRLEVDHLLMASTSSVYGANTEMPFTETEKADTRDRHVDQSKVIEGDRRGLQLALSTCGTYHRAVRRFQGALDETRSTRGKACHSHWLA